MSGTNLNYLVALRAAFPATTSACHSMVMLAAEVRSGKQGACWHDIISRSHTEAEFNRAFNQTITSIQQETNESNLTSNLIFLNEYLVRFAQACPDWLEAYEEVSEKMKTLRNTDARWLTRELRP
jgi:hypothetical protein